MVFKVISSECCSDMMQGSSNEEGTIQFIGGFPNGWPVAAYRSTCDTMHMQENTGFGLSGLQAPSPLSLHRRVQQERQQARLLLAAELAEASSYRRDSPESYSHHLRDVLEIISDDFGAPHLLVRKSEGPGISFSYSGDTIWAALCREDCWCGIDASRTDDFGEEYPYNRAFCADEIESFLTVANGNSAQAAALVWSAKEAVVKALGCAFHLIDPLQVQIGLCGWSGGAIQLTARFNALVRGKLFYGKVPSISLATVYVRQTWVSVAVTNRTPSFRRRRPLF